LLANHFCPDNWEIAADVHAYHWQRSTKWIQQYMNITADFSGFSTISIPRRTVSVPFDTRMSASL